MYGTLNNPEETFLNDMIKNICNETKLQGGYSNHSLHASGATKLFQHDTPEHIIQQFTGHRSVTALRQYEKVVDSNKRQHATFLWEHHQMTSVQRSKK